MQLDYFWIFVQIPARVKVKILPPPHVFCVLCLFLSSLLDFIIRRRLSKKGDHKKILAASDVRLWFAPGAGQGTCRREITFIYVYVYFWRAQSVVLPSDKSGEKENAKRCVTVQNSQ